MFGLATFMSFTIETITDAKRRRLSGDIPQRKEKESLRLRLLFKCKKGELVCLSVSQLITRRLERHNIVILNWARMPNFDSLKARVPRH